MLAANVGWPTNVFPHYAIVISGDVSSVMNSSALHVQRALVASVAKLQNSTLLTDEELQRLRGSVMRLVAEFSVLKETQTESKAEHSETHAA